MACAKFVCASVQVVLVPVLALGWLVASVRPLTVNRSCTPPSGVLVPGTFMNRASRTGVLLPMKGGMVFLAPCRVATAICGLPVGGLAPPTCGNSWHAAHELALKLGPSPLPVWPGALAETESISWKRSRAAVKKFTVALLARLGRAPPVVPAAGGV